MRRSTRQGGYSLLELTAVITIVGTLSAVALPRYADTMRSARLAKMELARGAVARSAQVYHLKWLLAGAPRTPTVLDGVEMNESGFPTSAGIVLAAGLADDYDTRTAGLIAADPQHPQCSLAYTPATGTGVARYAGESDC